MGSGFTSIVCCFTRLLTRLKEKYLWHLISQMNRNEKYAVSTNDPAWLAYRKAEKLEDPEYLPLLKGIISGLSRKEQQEIRSAAYFIMGKLLAKRPEAEHLAFFIDQITTETDQQIISQMLSRIGEIEIPLSQPMEAIIALTKDARWQIRDVAIYALGSQNSDQCRLLLRSFVALEDHAVHWREIVKAQAALMKIGDSEDIDLLEKNLNSRVDDIRESAEFVVKALRERMNHHEFEDRSVQRKGDH